MDPTRITGQIKEQVAREHITRRRYPQRWGELVKPEVTKFYDQNEINRQLAEGQEFRPFEYTGEGESFFVSRGMYESLCGKCRCGRPRSEAHILRCLQKEVDKFGSESAESETSREEQTGTRSQVPVTSNRAVGFIQQKPIYQQWEQSMKYVSPIHTMPGFRVTAKPYNAIKIG